MSQDMPAGIGSTVTAGGTRSAVTSPSQRFRTTHVGAPARTNDHLSRSIDVMLGGIMLILFAPLMALIAVVVRSTSRGPAIFRQSRLGYHKRPFVMLKFRSMATDCGDAVHKDFVRRMLNREDPRRTGNGLYKLDGDRRVTRVGRFLRATSLDELPQLINVLRGDMSLVGPRPALDWEVELYQPHHHERFEVKPGITGLWQVSGRSRLTMNEALELDVAYVRRRSVAIDLWILVRTLPAVLPMGAAR